MTTALGAVYDALIFTLKGSDVWDDRVYTEQAPADNVKPYVVITYVGGGDERLRGIVSPRIVLSVKVVAADSVVAFDGVAAVTAALNNGGEQEKNLLPVQADWHILTVTQDRIINLLEAYEGAEWIYHKGHQYVFQMEEKS